MRTKMCNSNTKILLFILILTLNGLFVKPEIIERCKERCDQVNDPAEVDDFKCNSTCSLHQCKEGCNLWIGDRTEGCATKCGTSQNTFREQQCAVGCNIAVDLYAEDITQMFSGWTAPVLAADSLRNNSLTLYWENIRITNLNYSLQIQELVRGKTGWKNHDQVRWRGSRKIKVYGLHPFVTYKFRVVSKITERHTVTSPASVSISTLPSGAPTSTPEIVSLTSSATSIHLRWEVPVYINAPLLSYRITVDRLDKTDIPKIKDTPADPDAEEVSDVITMLDELTSYKVTVTAVNQFGSGPSVKTNVTTPARDTKPGITPYLIFGSQNMILKQNLNDLYKLPDSLYENEDENLHISGAEILYQSDTDSITIQGVGIDYYRNRVYFTDSTGGVYEKDLNSKEDSSDNEDYPDENEERTKTGGVHLVYQSASDPKGLSVDWLHHKLYVAENNKIQVCNIADADDHDCRPVIYNMEPRPDDLWVDPCNGYLYWSQWSEEGDIHGLYRMSLDKLGEPITNLLNYRIVNIDLVSAFVVDYSDYRIYFPNSTQNTMLSAYLDGTDIRDIRTNVQTAELILIKSMVMYDGLFYWTNGKEMMSEELSPDTNMYHHNEMFFFDEPFSGLNIWHPDSQPIPVPLSAPKNLQATFQVTSVKVTWLPPQSDQGAGAWQGWQYEVEMYNNATESHQSYGTLMEPRIIIDTLQPDTAYDFRVRAKSTGGIGPWSGWFKGQTLVEDEALPYFVFADKDSIFETELSGKFLREVKVFSGFTQKVRDIEVYGDVYYYSQESGHVYVISEDGEPRLIDHISEAAALAYDPLAHTLYCSSPKNNRIVRQPLMYEREEKVYQGSSYAQDMVLDSWEGYVYWATSLRVEVAHLNGANHQVIFALPYFSGQYVLGLTLDLENRHVYWMVKDVNKALVYRTDALKGSGELKERTLIKELDTPPKIPGMSYYSNRLYWLSDAGLVTLLTTRSRHHTVIKLPSDGEITSFTMVYTPTALRFLKDGNRSLGVIPERIRLDSLTLEGEWYNFTLAWDPTPVQHGNVTYQLIFSYNGSEKPVKDTSIPMLRVTEMEPYTHFTMEMRSCTYWGCSAVVRETLHSPMAAPSPPQHPRTFVTFSRDPLNVINYQIKVSLYWLPPEHPNGIVTSYKIYKSRGMDGPWEENIWEPAQNIYLSNQSRADPDRIYYFKVAACTLKGCSNASELVSANTEKENPVPQLVTANNSAISILVPDTQYRPPKLLAKGKVIEVTFLAQEDTYYWLDKSQCIVKLIGSKDRKEILPVNGTGKSISADWIGRELYWTEEESSNRCVVKSYDLFKDDGKIKTIVRRRNMIEKLALNPYKSQLYWSERNWKGNVRLMRSNMDGSEVSPLFSHLKKRDTSSQVQKREAPCTCENMQLSSIFIMDHSKKEVVEIYIMDQLSSSIWAMDAEGCRCRLVVNATGRDDLGLPADSMAVDHQRLYWYNKDQGRMYSCNKRTGDGIMNETVTDVQEMQQILAIGSHLQPLPGPLCLIPNNYDKKTPSLQGRSSNSLNFHLDAWSPSGECQGISLPTINYTLHYRSVNDDDKSNNLPCDKPGSSHLCEEKSTFDLDVELDHLKPYTNYLVQVSAGNYYTATHKLSKILGPPQYFRTSTGIPTEPVNVTVKQADPHRLKVTWHAPVRPNGPLDELKYEIRWTKKQDSTVSTGNVMVLPNNTRGSSNSGRYNYYVEKLMANTTYTIQVLAYDAEKSGFSASEGIMMATYPDPNDIWLMNRGQHWLQVAWQALNDDIIVNHAFQYAEVTLGKPLAWQPQPDVEDQKTVSGEVYNTTFSGLNANTGYAVRLKVQYESNETTYFWPLRNDFTFKTDADIPAVPLPPRATRTREGVNVVVWRAPDDGGAPIKYYTLFASLAWESNWTQVYNGSATKWVASGLNWGRNYEFQVSATNRIGSSEASLNSSAMVFTPAWMAEKATKQTDGLTMVLASSFGVIVLVIFILILLLIACKKKTKPKPLPPEFSAFHPHRTPDVELATLRELPHNATQTTNALYSINIVPTDEDIAALPHFHREQLILIKFLGSGAFGEVFEGIANNIISNDSGNTKVAVKTLRKGASEQEKDEFLKEALLMSNFKHDHIIRLLGVCLDNDPQFIILELMEGGDLLSYLRTSRPTPILEAQLKLRDMVHICVDVARGCKYLEDMHFVHRDLAARNCLVSSRDPSIRKVKIGDFGLARDIYKNDYYRKEGEGLLPVRWMSPESLIDGVFTTQSDVWAFGVMMWEVLTLGQQPYPARTNIEVLHYVRSGGRLDRPENCPDDLYELMLKCWCYDQDERPSFHYMLGELEMFKQRVEDPLSDLYRQSMHPSHRGSFHNTSYDDTERYSKSNMSNLQWAKLTGLSGSAKLPSTSTTGRQRRLEDMLSEGAVLPATPQTVGEVLNGGVQRAQSCTLQQPMTHPHQPRDTHGYLEPVCTPKGRPRYLELLGDEGAVGGISNTGLEGATGGAPACDNKNSSSLRPPVSQSNKQLAASAPSLVSKMINPPNGKSVHPYMGNGHLPSATPPIMYAELDAESLEANLDKAHKALYRDKPPSGAVAYTPMSQRNGYPATSNSRAKGTNSHSRTGSYEPFLQPPCATNGMSDDGADLDPGSDSEHENKRLLGGRERRKSSSPFLRDLSPFIDRRRGTSPLLRDLSPFHSGRNSAERHRSPSVRYDELDRNNANDGYLRPRNHENDGYLKPRDSSVMGRPPIANGNTRHHNNRRSSVNKSSH